MKNLIIISFIILFIFMQPLPAEAGYDIKVVIDGQEYIFDPPPTIIEGSTLVPMRSCLESLGAEIYWEPETRTAVGIRDDVEFRIPVGSTTIIVGGIEKSLNVPAQLINSSTYIPLHFVDEVLGDQVKVVYSQTGMASWYGSELKGSRTASGEIFDPYDFTAAHLKLPFGTLVKVTFLQTGKSTQVRINDRGPHRNDRIIDLSRAAAEAIGLKGPGKGEVLLEVLD